MASESEVKYWYLRNHALFSHLNENEVQDLCVMSAYKKAKKNEVIYFSDQDISRIFILKEGRIKIAHYDERDTEIVSEILKEGDIFGEITLSGSKNTSNEFAQALTEQVVMCSFTIANFEAVLKNNPLLAIEYTKKIGKKLTTIRNKYSDIVLKDVRTRIVEFFRNYALSEGNRKGQQVIIQTFLTHQDIANITAASRQTVTTVINQLQAENKLHYEGRKRIFIPNIEELV